MIDLRRRACVLCLGLLLPLVLLDAREILVLHSFNETFPWTVDFNSGLREQADRSGGTLNLYLENLDVTRFGGERDLEEFARYITVKYRSVGFDALIGDGDHACRFLEQYCRFPADIPRVYLTTTFSTSNPAVLSLSMKYDEVIDKTWRLVRSVFPDMKDAAVIAGDPLITESVYSHLSLHAGEDGIPVRLIGDFTFDGLRDIVARLPPTTAVFYTPVLVDKDGNTAIPRQLLAELSGLTPAPIFSFWETMIGNGAVGGHVISARVAAREMLRAADEYGTTGSFGDTYVFYNCLLDWSAMERHKLNTDAIPADATVLNKPPPAHVRYAELVIRVANLALAAFSVILLVSIIAIFRSYRRLRGVNRQLLVARKEAEALSLRDALTGLGNRRAFAPMVEYELRRKQRFGSAASLIIADIDHFKKVNDTFGHETGDVVLSAVAHALQVAIRGTDTLARWGGEEFIILLPDTDERQGFSLAEKLRKGVCALSFDECTPVTISLGVAENAADEDFDDWFRRADQALFQAKQTGRNKTVAISGNVPDAEAEGGRHELLLLQINWREEYRVGVTAYDEQHRELFALANSLINSIVNNERKEAVVALLHALYESSARHFADEEHYLYKKRCSLIELHEREHAVLMRKISSNIDSYEKGDLSAYDFISFICNDLIVKHILGIDKESFEDIASP